MSEPRSDQILRELRTKAPPAPPQLRERVREITSREAQSSSRRWLRLRPALAVAAAAAVVVGVGAAVVNGLTGNGSSPTQREVERVSGAPSGQMLLPTDQGAEELSKRAASLPPGARLQRYEAFMRIRVGGRDELSNKTKRAMRDARALGGYVVSVRYGTPEDGQGDATLTLRVPVARVQEAIARFSSLGTLVTQRISLDDIQPQADRLSRRISSARSRIAELERKQSLTPAERAELAAAKRSLSALTRSRRAVVQEGTYARVALELTAQQPAEKESAPGRFDRFLDDAGSILATELVWLLYALVVAGPFVLLAIAAFVAERARRRRAADALLSHN
jgi:hypothetical protein